MCHIHPMISNYLGSALVSSQACKAPSPFLRVRALWGSQQMESWMAWNIGTPGCGHISRRILLVFHSHGGRCWAWAGIRWFLWNHQLQECGEFLLWEIAGGSIRGDTILGASSWWGSGSRRRCFGRRLLATAERLSAQRHPSEDDDHVGIFQDKWQTAHRFGQQ